MCAPCLSKDQSEPSTCQPLTLETTARVLASISAAIMACGHSPTAVEITSEKLPLPSKREMIANGVAELGIGLGIEKEANFRSRRGETKWDWEERLKRTAEM